MSTIRLAAVWGMLAGVAVLARLTAWDYAAALCTVVAMLPLALATGDAKRKRITVPVDGRRRAR